MAARLEVAAAAVDVAVDSRELPRGVVRRNDQPDELVLEAPNVAGVPPTEAVAVADRARFADLRPVAERRVRAAVRGGGRREEQGRGDDRGGSG